MAKKLEQQRKEKEELEKGKLDPKEMFIDESKYTEYDENVYQYLNLREYLQKQRVEK